jgi:hypothetical protein
MDRSPRKEISTLDVDDARPGAEVPISADAFIAAKTAIRQKAMLPFL